MRRDPYTFTPLMTDIMDVMFKLDLPAMPAEIARALSNSNRKVHPYHVSSPLMALKRGGWLKREKTSTGAYHITHSGKFPIYLVRYSIDEASYKAWEPHFQIRCTHNWATCQTIEHKPEFRICLDCGLKQPGVAPEPPADWDNPRRTFITPSAPPEPPHSAIQLMNAIKRTVSRAFGIGGRNA